MSGKKKIPSLVRLSSLEQRGRLEQAIRNDDVNTIKTIIEEGCITVNSWMHQPYGEYTGLHYSVQQNKINCVGLYLNLGADITIKDRMSDGSRKTPLQRAADDNKLDIVYCMIKEFNKDVDQGYHYQSKITTMIQDYESSNPKLVSSSKVPSAPTDLIAKALSHDQIKIAWRSVPDSGGADVSHFELKVTEMDTGALANNDRQLQGNQMENTIDGLKSNTNYRIQLAAVNCAGQSNFAEASVRTPASPTPQNVMAGVHQSKVVDINRQHKNQFQHEPQDQNLVQQQRSQQLHRHLNNQQQEPQQGSQLPQNQLQEQHQINQTQQQIKNLMKQLQQVQATIITEQGKSQSLRKRCELLESTSAAEQEKSQSLQKRCELLESASAAEQEKLESLRKRCELLESTSAAEQGKSQSLQKRCELLESTSVAEQEKSQSLRKRCKLLESTSAAEQEKSQSLQKRYELLESTLAAEQEKSQSLRKRCELLESTSAAEQEKSQSLRNRCELLEFTSAAEQQKSQSLWKRCELLESTSAVEQEKLQSLQKRCELLESTSGAEQEKSQSLQKSCELPGSTSAAEQEKLQSLERRCQTLESNLATEQQKSQTRYQNHEERLKEVEDTVERLWSISKDELSFTNKIIGTGGWGYVTEANYRGRKVAAKCLHTAITSSHNQQLFVKEMKIFARCRHRNLLQFIGAVPDHPAIIVTELMDTNLREALTNGRATPSHVYPICMDIAQALSYLHGIQPHPLIHRDVSAPNVLLKSSDSGWVAKLSDLGSAQFANIAQTLAPGCVVYAAPEVRHESSARNQTTKMDVYSYGVLLIEVLIRKMPIGDVEDLIATIQPKWLSYVSLIRQCTTNEPSRRPTMTKVIDTLNTITI